MKTEEKIVNKALEMFNEKGIEYVGLRELAAILGMRVSNITYYFPTKDDLVNRLSLDLNRHNSALVVADQVLSMSSFLEMFDQVFQNHVRYRCLLLSFVHLMEQNKLISERYKSTGMYRNEALKSNLSTLIKEGFLQEEVQIELDFLVSVIALNVRFWISEAAVSFRHLSTEEQIKHYTGTIGKFLLPYATQKGKDEIQMFLDKR